MSGKAGLNGLDLVPLPNESVFSVLQRFSWRNAFSFTQLKPYLNNVRIKGYCPFVYLAEQHLKEFETQTSWPIRECLDFEMNRFLGRISSAWIEDKLKFCPVCLQSAYHSAWYQLSMLEACPIHNCNLITYCASCGKATPRYALNRSLFQKVYCCELCSEPLSGAQSNLELHMELREHLLSTQDPMHELHQWMNRSSSSFWLANRLATDCNFHLSQWERWCDGSRLLRTIATQGNTLPTACAPTLYPGLTILKWRVASGHIEKDIYPRKSRSRLQRRAKLLPVYLATLRRLQKNIKEIHLGLIIRRNLDFELPYGIDQHLSYQDYPAEVLAYLLMRGMLERTEQISLFADIGRATLWNETYIDSFFHGHVGVIPKVKWRALILGIYAGIYHYIQKNKNSSELRLSHWHPYDLGNLVARVRIYDSPFTNCGMVIFPTIESMPNLSLTMPKKKRMAVQLMCDSNGTKNVNF